MPSYNIAILKTYHCVTYDSLVFSQSISGCLNKRIPYFTHTYLFSKMNLNTHTDIFLYLNYIIIIQIAVRDVSLV